MSDPLNRLSTALADRYRIERELGQGGMATVYLAEDVKHDRKVAIKVLRPELAAVLGAERFVQEIKTTANLQHPHILPLFDSGEADGFLYYVMPYIEGETLREKLNREKQLGIEEAIRITTEVADALDYAHRQNVIHRDIKPENILLHDGRPMVADFGIALAVSAAAGGRMTETGLSLGTPHYMSPEQATAEKDLTNRSDIYSLGCVLYEMLAGDPPHVGSTAQQIIMRIVTDDARPVTELRKSVPPNVAAAVAKGLERLPADRFETAEAMRHALGEPGFRHVGTVEATAVQRESGRRWLATLPWVTTVVLAGALVAALGTRTPSDDAVRYVNIQLPDSVPLVFIGEAPGGVGQPALALSPNGQRIVYVGRADTTTRLYVRELDDYEIRPLMGTEGAYSPCISPDGSSVGFFARDLLKRAALDGTQVTPITEAHWATGCSWSDDDQIVSITRDAGELLIAPAAGGAVERRTLARQFGEWMSHPRWLPGTAWLLGSCTSPYDLCVHSLESDEIRWLTKGTPATTARSDSTISGTGAHFLQPHYLLFSDPVNNVLLGARFDPKALTVESEPVVLRRGVRRENSKGVMQIAVSATGDLIFAEGENAIEARFVWADARGVERLPFPVRVYGFFHLSPNGRYIAAHVIPATGPDELWIMDLERRAERRWAGGALMAGRALGAHAWFPDSRQLLVAGRGNGNSSVLLEVDARTASGGRVLWEGPGAMVPERLHANGSVLMRVDSSGVSRTYLTLTRIEDLERLSGPAEDALPPVDHIPAHGVLTDLSPDGRWFAYASTETGSYEVYVQRLEPGARAVPVSRGGELPRFSPRGDGIYYRDGLRWYFVAFTGDEAEPFAEPRFVLEGEYQNVGGPEFEVAPDGRLLLLERTAAASTTTLHLILNWRQELERRLGS